MEKMYTLVTGNTLESHKTFVQQLIKGGATEVDSLDKSHVTIVFCPIVSRVETDINAALSSINISGFNPVILVVMHHTFNPNCTVPNSSRVVNNSSVVLVVDCLFYESRGLLDCQRNKDAVRKVLNKMGLPKALPQCNPGWGLSRYNPFKNKEPNHTPVAEKDKQLQHKDKELERTKNKLRETEDEVTKFKTQLTEYEHQLNQMKKENKKMEIKLQKKYRDIDDQYVFCEVPQQEPSREGQDRDEQLEKFQSAPMKMQEQVREKDKLEEEGNKQTEHQGKANMEKFYTIVTGNTLESHKKFVQQLIKGGATEVDSPDKSHVTIVFCPIVSRVETDINAALSPINISGFNPVILVVMHHTFDPNFTVPNSSRVVNTSSVVLVVDCLFYESRGLLDCQRNKDAVSEVLKKMDLLKGQTPLNMLCPSSWFSSNESNHTLSAEKHKQLQDELMEMKEQLREKDKVLKKIDKLLEERNKQIEHQGQKIHDLEAEMERLQGENSAQTIEKDKQLQDKDKELERLNIKLREKEDELKKMKKQLREKDEQLEMKLVEERNKQIEHQGQMINDLETDIESPEGDNSAQTSENDNQLQDKDEELARTNKKFRENEDELLKMKEQEREKDKQLDMKDKLVEERNKQIEHQGKKINDLETEMERLQEKDKQLQDKDEELERLNMFREKDDELLKMKEQLREKDKQLEMKDKLVEEGNKQIEHQGQKINDLETEMERLQGENSAQTVEKDKQLQDKDEELERLNNMFREKDDELLKMKEQLREKEEQLEMKDKLVEEGNKQIEHQGQKINDLKTEMERLQGENSAPTTGKAKMEKFYTLVTGNTLESHKTFVQQLIKGGATEVDSPDKSHVTIVFCPIVSRVETDINAALSSINISGFNPVILVVMHHTFKPNCTVPNSSRVVNNSSVVLVVDCLFYESRGLFDCQRNKDAVSQVLKKMDLPKGLTRLNIPRHPSREKDEQIEHQGQMKNDLMTERDRLKGKANMEKFYTLVTGNTLESHKTFVQQLIKGGATEVDSPDKSHVTIVFCPIVSRVETDINAALSSINISGFNPVILVVMHHTFDPNCTVPNSSRVVNNSSVVLVVDCLFYESRGLFDCQRNKDAVSQVLKKMDLPKGLPRPNMPQLPSRSLFSKNKEKHAVLAEKGKRLQHKGKELETNKNMLREKEELMKMQEQLREKDKQIEVQGKAKMETFYTLVTGNTLESHKTFVQQLIKGGATEVDSPDKSHVTIVFCPIVSRVETDINAALSSINISGFNPLILVVMHHTFNPNFTVPNSSRVVNNSSVVLVVDCLFYESRGLSDCQRNKDAVSEVLNKMGLPKASFLGLSLPNMPQLQPSRNGPNHTLLAAKDKQLQDKDRELERIKNKLREKEDELKKMKEQLRDKEKLFEEGKKQIEVQGQLINDLLTRQLGEESSCQQV
ncbi:uncharacterized protein [Centroberyx affinis]|uniref:uncharacterized protein isoform X3 n=1 Tax=Centroberyx affinis TaxID=166261 RepID=UPI003A5C2B2A